MHINGRTEAQGILLTSLLLNCSSTVYTHVHVRATTQKPSQLSTLLTDCVVFTSSFCRNIRNEILFEFLQFQQNETYFVMFASKKNGSSVVRAIFKCQDIEFQDLSLRIWSSLLTTSMVDSTKHLWEENQTPGAENHC